MNTLVRTLAVSLLIGLTSAAALAQPIEPKDYFRRPAFSQPTFSPDGKSWAVLAPVNDKLQIVIVDPDTKKARAITAIKDFDVTSYNWVGSQRLVFSLGNVNAPSGAGQADGGGLFTVDVNGQNSRKLSPTIKEFRTTGRTVFRGYSFVRSIPGTSEEIIAQGNMRDADSQDLYRLNLNNGRATLITVDRPQRTQEWILDRDLVPRIATTSIKDTNDGLIFYRSSADSPWKQIYKTIGQTGPFLVPLAFDTDNKTLQVASNEGRNTMGIFKYDPETGVRGELLASHPRFDMGANQQGGAVPGLSIDGETNKILGYAVEADRREVTWIDERYANVQALLDATFPGKINRFTRLNERGRVLVTSVSDVDPVKFYLFDEKGKSIEELFSSRPWIQKGQLSQMRPFVLKTRDGLEIPSYYFLPNDYKPGTKIPTVLHIHGGPAARADTWAGGGFGQNEAQLLASHGYAVIVPNFRVTPGMGSKIYYAGFGTIGRQMSEDHEDAAKWGIEQGFADPKKICISGASYGGYATLMGMAKTPDLFKCGLAGLVVSDLQLQLTSSNTDFASSVSAVAFWKDLIGVKSLSEPIVRQVSPAFLADKIKGPVFIYAGLDDVRTPIEQTNAIINALEKSGNPPKEVVVKKNEGHGFGISENRVDNYERILKFLAEHIGVNSKQ